MLKPPQLIDGYVVRCYGFLPGPVLPRGYVPPDRGDHLVPVQNFAVCTADGVEGFYLLCCTPEWRYVTYCYADTIASVKDQVETEFGDRIDLWHSFA